MQILPVDLSIMVKIDLLKSNLNNHDIPLEYPIIIQGIGADGKMRNCTVVILWNTADLISIGRVSFVEINRSSN